MEFKSSEERIENGKLVHSKTVDLTNNGGFIKIKCDEKK